MVERAREPARHARHGAVPRRGAPLQQISTGHVSALRRGRHADLRRRDHRESLLRGEQRAAVAGARLRAEAADGGGSGQAARSRAWRCRSAAWATCSLHSEPAARELLLAAADGDARRMLNLLETAADLSVPDGDGASARRRHDARRHRQHLRALRQGRREFLRPDLRAAQVGARQRSGCRPVLAVPHAGGRLRPACTSRGARCAWRARTSAMPIRARSP